MPEVNAASRNVDRIASMSLVASPSSSLLEAQLASNRVGSTCGSSATMTVRPLLGADTEVG